jgi:uncharacterized protein YegJ (DUF2314 family)
MIQGPLFNLCFPSVIQTRERPVKSLRNAIMTAVAVVGPAACSDSGDPFVNSTGGQEELNAAIEQARATLPRFFVELKGGEGDFSLKVPVRHGREVEHVWISDVEYASGKFTGQIASKAGGKRGAGFGQNYTVSGGDISDWMIERDGAIYGGYTLRATLDVMPDEQAASLRAKLRDLN